MHLLNEHSHYLSKCTWSIMIVNSPYAFDKSDWKYEKSFLNIWIIHTSKVFKIILNDIFIFDAHHELISKEMADDHFLMRSLDFVTFSALRLVISQYANYNFSY